MTLLLIAPLTSSNALSCTGPHWNLVSVLVKFLSGFLSDAYRGMNFDKYPAIPRKLLISDFDMGGSHS